jgi:hypothetical protein
MEAAELAVALAVELAAVAVELAAAVAVEPAVVVLAVVVLAVGAVAAVELVVEAVAQAAPDPPFKPCAAAATCLPSARRVLFRPRSSSTSRRAYPRKRSMILPRATP